MPSPLTPDQQAILKKAEKHIAACRKSPHYPFIRVITNQSDVRALIHRHKKNSYTEFASRLRKGDWSAMAALKEDLASFEPEVVNRALNNLHPQCRIPTEMIDNRLRALVVSLLETPATSLFALRALPTVAPDNSADRLIAKLTDPHFDQGLRRTAISVLGMTRPKPETIAFLASLYSTSIVEDDSQAILECDSILTALLDLDTQATSQQREPILHPILQADQLGRLSKGNRIDILRHYTAHPHPSTLPFFEQSLSDTYLKPFALLGLAKMQPLATRHRLLALLSDPATCRIAIPCIFDAWQGDPQGALEAWTLADATCEFHTSKYPILPHAWKMGGQALAEAWINAIRDPALQRFMQSCLEQLYLPMTADHPLVLQAAHLFDEGLLPHPIPPSHLEAKRREKREGIPYDVEIDLLEDIPSIIRFDNNSGSIPPNYPWLIATKFVPAAGGKLDQLKCFMDWDKSDDEYPDARVWLEFHRKAYTFKPFSNGKWYDLAAIQAAFDLLLKDARIKERFIDFSPAHEVGFFLWGEPKKAMETIIRLELGIPTHRLS